MTLVDQVQVLNEHLSGTLEPLSSKRSSIDFLLFDSQLLSVSADQIETLRDEMGIQIIDLDLAPENADTQRYDDVKLAEALLGLT